MDDSSNRMKWGYYTNKKDNKEFYEKLCKKYELHTTEEKTIQYTHNFGTHINKGMNTRVAKLAPKTKHYSKYVSLETRVKTVVDIYNCGYHFFCNELITVLEGLRLFP